MKTYIDKGSLTRNGAWMLAGEAAKLVVQAIYFVLIARSLGATQYGAFISVTAAATIASPFIGTGPGKLMIQNVSRDRAAFAECWGNTILMTALFAAIGMLVVLSGVLIFLPHTVPHVSLALIVGAEILFSPFITVCGFAFQAMEMLAWTANINFFATLGRLIALVTIVWLHHPTLMAWSTGYFAAMFLSAVVSVVCVTKRLGAPELGLSRLRAEFVEGLYFAAGHSAQTIYNDIDKTMLGRLATLDAVGIYAAAYRLVDVAFIPVRSLLAAAYPGFFRSGMEGLGESLRFGKQLLPRPVMYASVVGVGMFVGAPLVPWILGAQYSRTSEALRWLAILPILKVLHYFVADSLTGAGYQSLRTGVQFAVALFNVLLNLWVIPPYSWRGAAWTSLASDGMLAITLWSAALVIAGRERQSVLDRPIIAEAQGLP